ncbi:MAG: XTP/dITP diphosphatase [Acidilobus sp.]
MALYMVTRNRGKFDEARLELASFGIELRQLEVDKLEVQSEDVVEIASTAARHAYETFRAPLIVDDTGLYIEAFGGFPGPYSSYIIKKIGLDGVLRLMEGVANRRACFRTAVAYADEEGVRVFTGETCGNISHRPIGSSGFGYDPIFIPDGEVRTYAEMTIQEKNALSHRGKALRTFASWYVSRSAQASSGR